MDPAAVVASPELQASLSVSESKDFTSSIETFMTAAGATYGLATTLMKAQITNFTHSVQLLTMAPELVR